MTLTRLPAPPLPPAMRKLWAGPGTGLALRVLLGALALPVFFTLLGGNPPIGIYLSGAIVGCMHALVAIGLILVYRSNRINIYLGSKVFREFFNSSFEILRNWF